MKLNLRLISILYAAAAVLYQGGKTWIKYEIFMNTLLPRKVLYRDVICLAKRADTVNWIVYASTVLWRKWSKPIRVQIVTCISRSQHELKVKTRKLPKKMEKCKWRRCLLILLISFCIKSGWLSELLGIFDQSLSVVKQNQNKPRLPLYSFNIALTNNNRNNETAYHKKINAIERGRIMHSQLIISGGVEVENGVFLDQSQSRGTQNQL